MPIRHFGPLQIVEKKHLQDRNRSGNASYSTGHRGFRFARFAHPVWDGRRKHFLRSERILDLPDVGQALFHQ